VSQRNKNVEDTGLPECDCVMGQVVFGVSKDGGDIIFRV